MAKNSREEYDDLAPVYDRRWEHYVRTSVERALGSVKLSGNENVLDVGCGTGVLLEQLQNQHPNLHLHGLEPSRGMMTMAQKRCPETITLTQGQAEELPYSKGSFDVVFSVSALHYFTDPPQAIAEMHRVLRPGGKVLLVDWCADFLAMRLLARWLRFHGNPLHHIHRIDELTEALYINEFHVKQTTLFRIRPLWGMMLVEADIQNSNE